MGLLVDVGIELDVLVIGDERKKVEAHRVGAVHGNEVHRIDAVALGLRHATSVLGQDGGVDEDILEGNLVQEVQRAHDHAGDPQRDDVTCGHEHLGGMMADELLGMVGPALRGKGPQLAREPRVEHVLFLVHLMTAAHGTDVRVFHERIFPTAFCTMEDGDAMTPPELTRDAPVLEVLHPGHVGLRPALRMEGDLSIGNDIGCGTLELVDGNEPLLGEPGLERRVAAVAMHDGMLVVFHVIE